MDPNTGQLLGEIVFFFKCEVINPNSPFQEFVRFGSVTGMAPFGGCGPGRVVPVTVNLNADAHALTFTIDGTDRSVSFTGTR